MPKQLKRKRNRQMEKEIRAEDLQKFEELFDQSRINKVAMNAVSHAGVLDAARNVDIEKNNPFAFSIEVDAGKVCDQKQSGRCWMFAALNVMRLDLMKKLNLENMELSQNYPLFFDKLEKTAAFLAAVFLSLCGFLPVGHGRYFRPWRIVSLSVLFYQSKSYQSSKS